MSKNTFFALLITVLLVGGLFVLGRQAEPSWSNADLLGAAIASQGRDHIEVGDPHEPYNSNPPTSGPHAKEVDWGVYDTELPDENLVHNLEHGGIWISYKDINEDELSQLRRIAIDNSRSVVLTPRSANDSPIAVASWGRLLKLDVVDDALIREFIKVNKNHSPEPFAQ